MSGNLAGPSSSQTWPEPNYEDPTTRSWLPIFCITFHAFTTVLVWVRTGLRWRGGGGGLGLDDKLLVPSWLIATGFVALACYSSFQGFVDRHVWDVRPERLWEDLLNAWISQLLFVIGTGLLKISVLLFYRRIVSGTFRRRWKWAVWTAIGFTVAYSLALVLTLCLNCEPIQAYWKILDPEWVQKHSFKCHNTKALNPLAGSLTIFSDVYSVALPCLMCRKLSIPFRQKVALNAVFCTGLVVVFASGMRIWALIEFSRSSDITWTGFWVFFWTVLEYDLGLICTSAPTLRVLFKRQLPSQVSRSAARATELSSHNGRSYNRRASYSTGAPVLSPSQPADTYYAGHKSSNAKSSWDVPQDDDFKSLRTIRSEDERPIFGRTSDLAQEVEQISLHIIESARGSFRMGRRGSKL